MFELKQQSQNYRNVGNPLTCRQMSCRFGHPADTTFSCVWDMTSDVSRHVADTTQNVAVWATKSTRRHPTCGAKKSELASVQGASFFPQKNCLINIKDSNSYLFYWHWLFYDFNFFYTIFLTLNISATKFQNTELLTWSCLSHFLLSDQRKKSLIFKHPSTSWPHIYCTGLLK